MGRGRVEEQVEELRRRNREVVKECRWEGEVEEVCRSKEVGDTRDLPAHLRPWSSDVVGFAMEERGECRCRAITLNIIIIIIINITIVLANNITMRRLQVPWYD